MTTYRNKLFWGALSEYPIKTQDILKSIIFSSDFSGVLLAKDVKELIDLLGLSENELMLNLCNIAKSYAKPPISNFYVGAISKGLSGNLYFGANMEFPKQALIFSVHAEQASVMNAWEHGEQGIISLAVNEAPCGYCRQFLNELTTADKLTILLPNKPPRFLQYYLPDSFGPKELKVTDALMQKTNHRLQLIKDSDDLTVLAALNAANKSHAPYTKAYSGIAILTKNNKIYSAAYAENAAFNPSISPMSCALANLNFSKEDLQAIQKVVLVEIKNSLISQVDTTHALLNAVVSDIQLHIEYVLIES